MARRFFPLYNVDQPVGPGKPNLPDDVRLVQNLFIELSRFYANKDWHKNIPQNLRDLSTTSSFDDKLETWIKTFQNWIVKDLGGGTKFKSDGIIDPMPIHEIVLDVHFRSGRLSTLSVLCNHLWRHDRDVYLHIGDHDNMKWFPRPWFP